MRTKIFVCFLMVIVFVCSCDPGGLRRVQLRLHNPVEQDSAIAVDSPDIQEALRILNAIVVQHGFQLTNNEPG